MGALQFARLLLFDEGAQHENVLAVLGTTRRFLGPDDVAQARRQNLDPEHLETNRGLADSILAIRRRTGRSAVSAWSVAGSGRVYSHMQNDRIMRVYRVGDEPTREYVDTTAVERLEMMWQLTLDTWEFKGGEPVESRLPRHVVRVIRGGG